MRKPNKKVIMMEVKKASKEALLSSWKNWVQWVQTYLELDMDPIQVSLGTIRAPMAIKAGTRLNWAKSVTKQLHEAVVAIQKETQSNVCGQSIAH